MVAVAAAVDAADNAVNRCFCCLFVWTITVKSELDSNGLVLFAWTAVLGMPKVSRMCCFELDVLMLARSVLDVGSLKGFIIEHTPLPAHSPGHRCSHRSPANPLSHSHVGKPNTTMVNKNNGQKRIMVKNIIVKTRMSNNINGQTMTMVKQ